MAYIKEQKNCSTVIDSLKIFSIQKKTIFCRESLFIHALKKVVMSPHTSTASRVNPRSRQSIRCTSSSIAWAMLEDRSASEISPRCHFFTTKPVGHSVSHCSHPGGSQAHWSLSMLEGSKNELLRNAFGYSGTLSEVGENCFQLSEVARFCEKRIFLNFAVFHFFLQDHSCCIV